MLRLIDSFFFATERLWQHRVLVFWALVGLVAATTLALSLPLYVDAVNADLLSTRLPDPPYAFRLRYLGSWKGNIAPTDFQTATDAVLNGFAQDMGLPALQEVSFMRGTPWNVRLTSGSKTVNLGAFSMGALSGAESQMQIVKGQWPPAARKDNAPYPVLIPERMLFRSGLDVGDKLTVTPTGGKATQFQIAAIWKPIDSTDPSWIFTPKFFDEIFLLQTEDLATLMTGLKNPVEEAAWYLNFDGRNVKTVDVDPILTRITDGERNVSAVLPGIRLEVSPVTQLRQFSADVSKLTQQLVIMVLPVVGLIFYFVGLVAGLLVSRQQTADVTLRSRGMSRFAILRVHFFMWAILAASALGIGIYAAPYLVRLVGQTTSFLRFDNFNEQLEVIFTPFALFAGAVTGLIAASSGLLVAWRTTRQTITSFKQQSARARRAWWQRFYLDIMLLLPAYYVLYTMTQRGGLASSATDPFADPIVFMGPTLFALGNTLLFLRLWPTLIRFGGWMMSFGRGIAILMALRELTRSISRYRGALLMTCFTLSLIGFTASMASTLDRSLEDTISYSVGADLVLVTAADAVTQETTSANSSETTQEVTGYTTLPIDDLRRVEEIADVTRVGRYPSQMRLSGRNVETTLMAIDREYMAAVARFRNDYTTLPLADLMNELAGNSPTILISAPAAAQYKLKIGQTVTYQVQALGQWYETKATVAGIVDYFPTLNPTTKPFIITSLLPIWELVGTELPSDVWIRVKPGADKQKLEESVKELGFPIVQWIDPEQQLFEAKTSPARRGVLGFLSVGFIASIALTLVGSIIQNAASFRAQAVQLGSLRAMGLGSASVGVYLIVSQGLAVTSGILGGTGIGAATTLLYLPLLDFSSGLPPYLVRVAWSDIVMVYALFSGVLFVVILLTTIVLGRQSLFTIVKLGDNA